ncbi:MAG: ATP-binding protein [Thermoplasmatota archaeon]|nr:ATP-binding protein [Halobacteriales archaeon]
MPAESNAQELLDSGLRPQRATDRLRGELMRRLQQTNGQPRDEALRGLFPGVVMEDSALESLVASLLSGGHVLVLGPPGSGKTTLAKALWQIMPRDLFAVADCPLQCDPMSLVDAAFSRTVPPCPFCMASHGAGMHSGNLDPARIKAKDVPVRRVQLREGHGFSRVQGSAEVFPDNLTGSVNLARLEEIGDPTSPLVLEPGKVLQAHRGLLLVDEVGKLPRGTQNVLLQALQEGMVTPAKTRETFPADFVAVATSNLRDVGAITEPLSDRLSSIHHGLPTTASNNRRIVDLGLADLDGMPVPGPYRDAAVRLMMLWRARVEGGDDLAEVGSNRTLVETLRRARAYAILEGSRGLDPEDFRRGAKDAMLGRVRARTPEGFEENRRIVAGFVANHWKAAARDGAQDYWCRFFVGELKEDKAEATRTLQEVRTAIATTEDRSRLQSLLRAQGGEPRLRRFALFVQEAEGADRERAAEVLPAVMQALDGLGAFEAKGDVKLEAKV